MSEQVELYAVQGRSHDSESWSWQRVSEEFVRLSPRLYDSLVDAEVDAAIIRRSGLKTRILKLSIPAEEV